MKGGLWIGMVLCLLRGPLLFAADEAVMLKVNLKQGDIFQEQRHSSALLIIQLHDARSITTEYNSDITITGEVVSVDPDGAMQTRHTIDALKLDGSSPAFSFKFDSADVSGIITPAVQFLNDLIGKSYTMQSNSDGSYKLEGVSELVETMKKYLPDENANERAYLESMFEGLQSSNSWRNIYPPHPVKVNDTWEIEPRFFSGKGAQEDLFKADNKLTCRLKERRDGTAVIELLLPAGSEELVSTFKNDRGIRTQSFKFTGVVEIDEASGWIKLADVKMEAEAVMGPLDGSSQEVITFVAEIHSAMSLPGLARPGGI